VDLPWSDLFKLFNLHPALTGALGFLSGLLLGHWLSLGRDRRKEYNDIAQPIRDQLLRARDTTRPRIWGMSAADLDALSFYLGPIRRGRLMRSMAAYKTACDEQRRQNSYGELQWENPDPIVAAVDGVLSAIKRR
jgi:hypothetical protein